MFRVVALFLLCLPMLAQANPLGEDPAKVFAPGDYLCSMGSYRYKRCTITHTDGKVRVKVPEGARFPFEGELWATDDKGMLVFDGRMTDPDALCPTCPDDKVGKACPGTVAEKRACHAQPLRAALKRQKDGLWVGQLHHYLLRGIWTKSALTGHYRLGLTDTFRIWKRPAKSAR